MNALLEKLKNPKVYKPLIGIVVAAVMGASVLASGLLQTICESVASNTPADVVDAGGQ